MTVSRSQYRLTPEIQREICAYIRAGGFAHVAAEAAGIPREVFDQWLQLGQREEKWTKYHEFHAAIRQSQAQARLTAEIAAFKKDPVTWLKQGPGREKADNPGWTTAVKPQLTG